MLKSKKYYDKFFTNYPFDVHDSPARFTFVSELLKGRVLDVACGTGTLSKYFSGDYVGVDFSDVAIDKAKLERRKDAVFIALNFTKEFHNNDPLYDSAYLGEFLEHIEDDKIVFENLLRFLKPDGKIIVSVPNGDKVPDESHCRTFTVPQIRKEYSKYGKIKFYNWEGADMRIVFSIDLGKENSDEISLVMIVKDEQKGLERAILSALPLVDRVVISVDSKSSDKTEVIAKLYADELRFHAWKNDFSKARNFAQENVKSKWILFLDGHEYIEDFGDVKEKLKSDVEGIFVTVRMESGLEFLFPRIYRSYIKFKNAVHNVNECKTRKGSPNFVIIHDREGGQDEKAIERRNEQREKMMPEELRKELKIDRKNPRAHFHLANFCLMQKDVKQALKHYKAVVKYGKSQDQNYMSYLQIGALQLLKGNTMRSLWALLGANKLTPGRCESARALGGFYFTQKKYDVALEYLVKALKPNNRRYMYQPMEINKVEVYNMIARCLTESGEHAKAIISWEESLKHCTNDKEKNLVKQKIKLVQTLL